MKSKHGRKKGKVRGERERERPRERYDLRQAITDDAQALKKKEKREKDAEKARKGIKIYIEWELKYDNTLN